ncbi:hypothetical protein KGQ19_27985 [Catenulispora sp. NL8]|uniref:PilZ domain-containing protein n=1 Tax=Catenulispora pinistramenti TaxID=2705254 RepID=A0ABS5KXC6_9ACTN|nr:hypothetical protein [Catenulispora pinistramenti]MBS2550718.1 hypothetical protein [Catenulispora pinistramenti]
MTAMVNHTQTPDNLLPQRAQYVRDGIGMGIISINPDPAHPAVRLVLRDLSGTGAFAEFQVTARPGDVIGAGSRRLTITEVVAAPAGGSDGGLDRGYSDPVGHIAFRDEPVVGAS